MLLQNVTCKKSHLTVSQIRVVVSISMNLPVERPLSKGPASMSFRPSVIKRCACDLKAILLWVHSSRLATWWKKSPLDLMRFSPFWCVVGWEGFDAKSQFSRQAFCVFCEYFMHFVQAQSCHFLWRPHFVYSVRNWQNFMLPGGQLLFTNSNLHRHFKAQISQAGSCLWFMPKKLSVFMCVPFRAHVLQRRHLHFHHHLPFFFRTAYRCFLSHSNTSIVHEYLETKVLSQKWDVPAKVAT